MLITLFEHAVRKHSHHGDGKLGKAAHASSDAKVRPLASEAGEEDPYSGASAVNFAPTPCTTTTPAEPVYEEAVKENGSLPPSLNRRQMNSLANDERTKLID